MSDLDPLLYKGTIILSLQLAGNVPLLQMSLNSKERKGTLIVGAALDISTHMPTLPGGHFLRNVSMLLRASSSVIISSSSSASSFRDNMAKA